jgi:hypothetical protein
MSLGALIFSLALAQAADSPMPPPAAQPATAPAVTAPAPAAPPPAATADKPDPTADAATAPVPAASTAATAPAIGSEPAAPQDTVAATATTDTAPEPAPDPALELLGKRIEPGTRARVYWRSGATFLGDSMQVPVTVVHGAKPGPVLCLTGAIHGDELNGVEVIRRVLGTLDATELVGSVIGVPIINMAGFSRGSRYLPDRRDLNRFFPGNPNGSSASRIATISSTR